jgi:nucleoside-diphosphate-sugar epimerase
MTQVLVTGAAGFIGSRLVEILSARGFHVTGVDCFLPDLYSAEMKRARFAALAHLPGVELVEADLRTDPLSVLGTPDVVVNQAAMPGLTKSWEDLQLYLDNNVVALDRVIRATASDNLKKFIQISTSSVYGRIAEGTEDSPTNPFSPYGVSKLASEKLGFAHRDNFGLPFTVLRYFSVYGPGHRPDMAYHRFLAAARDGAPITVFGDGEQRRTNTYVDDCVEGTIAAIEKARPGEIYNLSGSESVSLNEALKIIKEISGASLDIRFEPARAGDQRETRGAIEKARSELGYAPSWSLRDGLQAEWEWIQTLPMSYAQA